MFCVVRMTLGNSTSWHVRHALSVLESLLETGLWGTARPFSADCVACWEICRASLPQHVTMETDGARREGGEMLKNAVSLVPLRILSLSVFVGVSRSSWLLADASPPPALQPCSTAQHRSKSRDQTDTEGWVNVMSLWLVLLVMLYCVC